MKKKEKKGLNISTNSFLTAIGVLLVLMIATYVLTLVIPSGELARTVNEEGRTVIDLSGGLQAAEGNLTFLRWLASPVLVLFADGNTTIIAVIALLLVIGGIFNSLDKSRLTEYMLKKIIHRFGSRKYVLMAAVTGFFMLLGAFVGSFEECVPLVPLVVTLAVGLGWDAETGLAMSLMAVGCGFASGVMNPFTVGVAQKLAGVPVLSGMGFRLLSAAFIYVLLLLFIRHHAKKLDRMKPAAAQQAGSGQQAGIGAAGDFEKNVRMDRGIVVFASVLGIGILILILSSFLTFLQDYTMILVSLMFLVAGISSTLVSGMHPKELLKTFGWGMLSILPAVLMILMASSVRFSLEEAKIMDTILYAAARCTVNMPRPLVILFIYLIALVVNFFVSSGSAEAVLLMPLLMPIADLHGISGQLTVLAYAYGDGFSNVLYPTNAVLLICLGLVGMSYGKYVKYSWKFQAMNLILTSGMLVLGLMLNYS